MPGIIAYILLFLVSALAAAGMAKLFFTLLGPGELLEKWECVLLKLEPKKGDKHYLSRLFLYKRLGGCLTCTRQQISDIAFAWLCVIVFHSPVECPTSYIESLWLKMPCDIILYGGFSAISLYLGQLLEMPVKKEDEESIIETVYYNKNEN